MKKKVGGVVALGLGLVLGAWIAYGIVRALFATGGFDPAQILVQLLFLLLPGWLFKIAYRDLFTSSKEGH